MTLIGTSSVKIPTMLSKWVLVVVVAPGITWPVCHLEGEVRELQIELLESQARELSHYLKQMQSP